jgi:hypothetical protein
MFFIRERSTHTSHRISNLLPRDPQNRDRENIDAIDRDDRLKTIDVLNHHRVTPHHRSHCIASPMRLLFAG